MNLPGLDPESPTIFQSKVALSIWQPWAWLIVRPDLKPGTPERTAATANRQIKDVENRKWHTSRRGWVAIHADKTFDQEGVDFVHRHFPQIQLPQTYDFGGLVGEAFLENCVQAHHSPWFFGPYGFVLSRAKPMPFTPLRGLQLFFRLPSAFYTAK